MVRRTFRQKLIGVEQEVVHCQWTLVVRECQVKQRDVHLFVLDSLSDWEAGYAVAGINNPQFQLTPGSYRVRTVSLQRSSVLSIGGIRIEPDLTLDRLSPTESAMLILPGGTAWDSGENMEAVQLAGSFLDAGVPVAAICGATAGLARGGLLDHRRARGRDESGSLLLGNRLWEVPTKALCGELWHVNSEVPLGER